MIVGWILKVKRGYAETWFQFVTIEEARAFIIAWDSHRLKGAGYDDGKIDEFTIMPMFEEEREDKENGED